MYSADPLLLRRTADALGRSPGHLPGPIPDPSHGCFRVSFHPSRIQPPRGWGGSNASARSWLPGRLFSGSSPTHPALSNPVVPGGSPPGPGKELRNQSRSPGRSLALVADLLAHPVPGSGNCGRAPWNLSQAQQGTPSKHSAMTRRIDATGAESWRRKPSANWLWKP